LKLRRDRRRVREKGTKGVTQTGRSQVKSHSWRAWEKWVLEREKWVLERETWVLERETVLERDMWVLERETWVLERERAHWKRRWEGSLPLPPAARAPGPGGAAHHQLRRGGILSPPGLQQWLHLLRG
jgi:hypothetical protein